MRTAGQHSDFRLNRELCQCCPRLLTPRTVSSDLTCSAGDWLHYNRNGHLSTKPAALLPNLSFNFPLYRFPSIKTMNKIKIKKFILTHTKCCYLFKSHFSSPSHSSPTRLYITWEILRFILILNYGCIHLYVGGMCMWVPEEARRHLMSGSWSYRWWATQYGCWK